MMRSPARPQHHHSTSNKATPRHASATEGGLLALWRRWQHPRPRHAQRTAVERIRKPGIALVALVCVALSIATGKTPALAGTTAGVQNVVAGLSTDATVGNLTSSVAYQDASGAVQSTITELSTTTDAAKLPARIQTAWWFGDKTGSDLAALKGVTGRIVIEVSVQNLTTAPQEVSVDSGGSKYRQYALIAAPLTVTATAHLGPASLGSVITIPDPTDARTTNGVASSSASNGTTVQWATILAPPMTLGTAVFRLVVEAKNFTLPTFDLTVQPGVVTDPSMENLFTAQKQANQSLATREAATIQAVSDVSSQVAQVQQFVGSVYTALSQDATTLGSQTYADLQAGSSAVLSQISTTTNQLAALGQQSKKQMTAAQGAVTSSTSAMLDNLNANVLGSTTDTPQMTQSSVANCTLTMPELAANAPHTLASSIQLMQAQLQTVENAFADPTTLAPAGPPDAAGGPVNCRDALIGVLQQTVGTPDEPCPQDSSAAPSILCTIKDAQGALSDEKNALTGSQATFQGQLDALNVPQMAGQATLLQTDLNLMGTDVKNAQKALGQGTDDITTSADQLSADLNNAIDTVTAMQATLAPLQNTDGTWKPLQTTITQLVGSPQIDGSVQSSIAGQLASIRAKLQQVVQDNLDPALSELSPLPDKVNSVVAAASSAQSVQPQLGAAWTAASSAAGIVNAPHANTPDPLAGFVTRFDNLLGATEGCTQEATWDGNLSDASSAQDVATALHTAFGATNAASCPLSPLALAMSPMLQQAASNQQELTALASALSSVPTSGSDPVSALATALNQVQGNASSIAPALAAPTTGAIAQVNTAADALNDLTGPDDALATLAQGLSPLSSQLSDLGAALTGLSTQLGSLYTPPSDSADGPSGTLANIKTDITDLANLAKPDDNSNQQAAQQLLNTVADDLSGIYTHQDVLPTSAPACPDGSASTAGMPSAPGDAVIWLSNAMTCQMPAVDSGLTTWADAVTTALNGANTTLDHAQTDTGTALNSALTKLGNVSDELISQLQAKTGTLATADLNMIGATSAQDDQQLATVMASFTNSTNPIVTNLIAQLTSSSTDLTTAQTELTQDFNAVLANLGSPNPTSQVGLLGQLHTSAALIQNAEGVLGGVSATTTGQGNQLSSDQVALALQAAQFQAAQDRIAAMPSFPGLPVGVSVPTVYSFHVGE